MVGFEKFTSREFVSKILLRENLFPGPRVWIGQNAQFPKTMPPFFVHIPQSLIFRRKKQKIFEKPIDNGKKMCYNVRAIGQKPKAQRQKIYIKRKYGKMTREQKTAILAMVAEMPQNTATEKARVANILRHLANAENDSGAYGRICEIFAKSEKSHAVNFAKQGRADCFVWVDGKRYNAEYKTNGGRIGSLYGKKAPKFVVYQMDICNAGTSNLRRVVEPIVMRTEKFLAILEECKATKSTNGTNPEMAIQVTSKKLFIALSEYTLTYDPNHRYTETDF